MRESDIVRKLDKFLTENGWLSFPQNSRVPHGRTRYKNGTPDILACSPGGNFFGFEVKVSGSAKLRASQISMVEKVWDRYVIVTEDGTGLIYRWGALDNTRWKRLTKDELITMEFMARR